MDLNYKGIAEGAVEVAKDFDTELDFTRQSIQNVDEILGTYFEQINEYSSDEKALWNIAVLFGIYIGETLLRNGLAKMGFKWFVKGDLPVLRNDLKNIECSPITKAHKRILNGPEDSVVSFCDVSFVIAHKGLKSTD